MSELVEKQRVKVIKYGHPIYINKESWRGSNSEPPPNIQQESQVWWLCDFDPDKVGEKGIIESIISSTLVTVFFDNGEVDIIQKQYLEVIKEEIVIDLEKLETAFYEYYDKIDTIDNSDDNVEIQLQRRVSELIGIVKSSSI